MTEYSVLLVDDDPDIHTLVRSAVDGIASFVGARDAAQAERALRARPEVVLIDLELGAARGDDLVDRAVDLSPLSTVFVMSGVRDTERAVALIRKGAEDCLLKPVDPYLLRRKIERALARRSLVRLADGDGASLDGGPELDKLALCPSEAMIEMVRRIPTIAASTLTAMVTGETGTGKELVARAIHFASPRRDGPFVVVNCGALPRELMEAELFGHTAGAFTGAKGGRRGLIREASGGTLMLDEVGELPMELQPKLLRFLQEGELRAVGSDRTETVDVRVVAATHRDLPELVADGRFREDLYFRLNVIPLEIPPLRERRADIAPLAEFFLREAVLHSAKGLRGFDQAALRALSRQDWPGNVRELQHRVHRASVFAAGPLVSVGDLDLAPEEEHSDIAFPGHLFEMPIGDARTELVASFEAAYVKMALEEAQGNVAAAARIAGLPRKSFWRVAQRVGLAADRASRKAGMLDSDASGEVALSGSDLLATELRAYRERTAAVIAEAFGRFDGRPGLEDWTWLRATAHKLRGSGGSYGLARLSELAGELEEAAGQLDLDASRGLLAQLRDAAAP
jgi:DNA-binding NtrC family response regulator/HPt (histidine-containing phosphotransfer) domain-containing protein